MTWIKQNEELYNHDTAPFSIVKQNNIWYVVDSRDQSKAVPYDDIFNNPVYDIDFSSKTVLAKHFRAEGVNTPGTPGFSFQGDANTGFYRIAEDTIGGAVGGNKVFEVNALGLQNGTLGTDLRNILNTTLINQPFSTTYSMPAGTTAITTGLNFSYTPKLIGSRILINLICPVLVSTATNNSIELYLYATGTALASGLTPTGGNYSNPNGGLIGYDLGNISNNTMSFPLIFWHTPTSLSPIIFNLIARNRNSSASTTTINSSNFGATKNLVTIQELN